ncbi:hypothetical protein MH1LPH_06400 [Lactiplantibacillus brownii]
MASIIPPKNIFNIQPVLFIESMLIAKLQKRDPNEPSKFRAHFLLENLN